MDDIITYFRRITGFIPTPEQEELLKAMTDDSIEKMIVSCGRGFSKTLCGAVVALWYAEKSLETGIPIKVMIASPQDTLYEYVNQYFSKSDELKAHLIKHGVYTEVPVEGFELDNGSKVFTKPATGKVRSNRADILILDETADIVSGVIKSASMCLTGNSPNRIIMISTPHKTGYFVEMASEPDKYGYILKQWSAELCPWQAKTIERAKSMLTPEEYAIEVCGRIPTKAERAFFPSKHIDACIIATDCAREGGLGSTVEVGIDWGFDPCKTVVFVTEKIYSKRKVIFVKAWHRKPIEDIAPEIAQIIDGFNPAVVKADAKPAEYKGHVEKYTKHKIYYVDGPMYKDQMLTQMQRRIRQHQLIIPEHFTNLILDLRRYHKGMRTGDIVDACALSCWEPSVPFQTKPQGRVVF